MYNYLVLVFLFFGGFSLESRPRKKAIRLQKTVQQSKKQSNQTYSSLRKRKFSPKKVASAAKPTANKVVQPIATETNAQRLLFLKKTVADIVKKNERNAEVGVKVVHLKLKNNNSIYKKNEGQAFIPASNTKVFTAAAAYHILGLNYLFVTKLTTDQLISPNKINNLYLKGSGDPTLTVKDLESLVLALKARGIREIKGDLIVDHLIFDTKGAGPGWSKGDGPIFDKSPTSGLLINHSLITVQVQPARAIGKRPFVSINPINSFVKIENNAKTTGQAKKNALHVFRGTHDDHIHISGSIPRTSKTKYYRFAVEQPHYIAGYTFAALLKKHNISLKGQVRFGKASQTVQLAQHSSASLKDIVRHMMKKSDNLYADSLFKAMGAKLYQAPGTWEKGKKAVAEFLKNQAKMPTNQLSLNDGSGLSHDNRVTPDQLSYLLEWMYVDSGFKEIFVESFPIGGVDGTLRRRMKQHKTHASVNAKTGNLPGITSLSGYITPKTGLPLIFVIMVNRRNKSAVEFKRKLEDHLCTFLAAHAFSVS